MITRTDVIERLAHFGYIVKTEELAQVDYELEKILNYVKNYCHITEIPDILDLRICDRVCAEYLFIKKNSGKLDGFDYDAAVKQIKEGDTTISYAVGQGEDTPENRFDALVKQLERGFDKWITPYRALRW